MEFLFPDRILNFAFLLGHPVDVRLSRINALQNSLLTCQQGCTLYKARGEVKQSDVPLFVNFLVRVLQKSKPVK